MPLSKKRNRERMKQKRAVQPDDALQSISRGIKRETDSTAPPVQPNEDRVEMPLVSSEDRWAVVIVQPIPNCPDGRYREKGG